ncbi:hypothetical protein AAFF_G00061570 [Aldrovandia affinis]|uniref:Uncharacterized protein n=1 Tax=Aldrovandia affinis TaxID=143900 RepID=A0AAD7WEA4_9TELE|nr:hypothetical protein AAFF_G00061570 [Aldrovandia affinis]
MVIPPRTWIPDPNLLMAVKLISALAVVLVILALLRRAVLALKALCCENAQLKGRINIIEQTLAQEELKQKEEEEKTTEVTPLNVPTIKHASAFCIAFPSWVSMASKISIVSLMYLLASVKDVSIS